MKLSTYNFTKIGKISKDVSTIELLERTNFIKQVSSGSFVYLHLMQQTLNNVCNIIKSELNESCLEIGINQLQSAELWKKTGRYDAYGDEMFKFKDRKDRDMVLAGTNEELITDLASQKISSYRDLNFTWYCISNKFRDEIRTYNGLERCKEFVMMDAYSFHDNVENLTKQYDEMKRIFCRVFERLGLNYEVKKADSGEIGGSVSEEFVIDGMEVAHIFQLDDKYSKTLDCKYVDRSNAYHNVMMGCYGIGISRLLQVIANVKRTNNYIDWGEGVSAYQYGIMIANSDDQCQKDLGNLIYARLKNLNRSVYLDDRNIRLGEKLNEIDVLGTFNKIIIGKKAADGMVELKHYQGWSEIHFEKLF